MFDSPGHSFQESFDPDTSQPFELVSRIQWAAPTLASVPDRKPQRPAARHSAALNSDAEFRAIYEKHLRFVRCTLRRLGVRESDVQDTIQKVFMVAFLKLPEFEGRSRLSTWLWAICRRVAIAYRRSGAMRLEVTTDPYEFDFSIGHQPFGCSEAARSAANIELGSSLDVPVEQMLSKLSESQRIVFQMSEVDDLDGRQIAKLLNISLGTVRSRLRYARQRIRREVKRLTVARAFGKKVTPEHFGLGWELLECAS